MPARSLTSAAAIEAELRRLDLITRHTGWSETAALNEFKLDLFKLHAGYRQDVKRRIRQERKAPSQ